METSEQLPPGAVDAADLAELARRSGPLVSVYLNSERTVENVAPLSERRWKTVVLIAERLRVQGERIVEPIFVTDMPSFPTFTGRSAGGGA